MAVATGAVGVTSDEAVADGSIVDGSISDGVAVGVLISDVGVAEIVIVDVGAGVSLWQATSNTSAEINIIPVLRIAPSFLPLACSF